MYLIKLLFAILVTIPINACGSSEQTLVDERLSQEISRWVTDCRQNLPAYRCTTSKINEIVLVNDLTGNKIGECEISVQWVGFRWIERRKISISSSVILNTYYSRALILHEILHCQFDVREHTDSGIMRPVSLNEWELRARWPELITEAYELVK